MSDEQFLDKDVDNDPERTLITLDQLSQTIEVMTSVVNRLRRHLSEQLKSKMAAEAEQERQISAASRQIKVNENISDAARKRESFVVEINQQEIDPDRKSNKILH